ncbi:hypothetical protein FPY71_16175 [Aureimonas fodinaquatilis]|uniref:Uncharacterized protein n=1 Tax=Aureimonas fodinaquatilis TaxID=2565783 RepID=A0A5B0DPV1_9HYPH|nr:hypothetical protein [Aureimonas fodinaquatilis]KAA0968433.1 hypothetical protein FPY71_16175 [Aureimonas fodinaquatilis]
MTRAAIIAGILNDFIETRNLKELSAQDTEKLGELFVALMDARIDNHVDAELVLGWQADLLQALVHAVEAGRLSIDPLDVLRYTIELVENVISYLGRDHNLLEHRQLDDALDPSE